MNTRTRALLACARISAGNGRVIDDVEVAINEVIEACAREAGKVACRRPCEHNECMGHRQAAARVRSLAGTSHITSPSGTRTTQVATPATECAQYACPNHQDQRCVDFNPLGQQVTDLCLFKCSIDNSGGASPTQGRQP